MCIPWWLVIAHVLRVVLDVNGTLNYVFSDRTNYVYENIVETIVPGKASMDSFVVILCLTRRMDSRGRRRAISFVGQ